jgi:hypothetical protein
MTLSRHFYVLEEVAAALRQACIQRSLLEAHFWLQELVDSDEAVLAVSTLVQTYILYYGVSCLEWLRQAHAAFSNETISVDALFDACTALCRLEERDASFVGLHLLMSADKDIPDTVTCDKVPIDCDGAEEEYFARALLQGKVRAALWVSVAQSASAAIVRSLAALQGTSEIVRIIEHMPQWASITIAPKSILCLQCMVIGLRPAELKKSFLPCSTVAPMTDREEWVSLLGRRRRRLYTPHWSAYYLETRRGRMSYKSSTMTELLQLGGSVDTTYAMLRGCNYWEELLEQCMRIDGSDKDNVWETFCGEAFPDDIPDEWSAADREKSHGPGLVGGAEDGATVRKWLQRFIWVGARYLYGCEATIMGIVAAQSRIYGPDHQGHHEANPNSLLPHIVQYVGPAGPLLAKAIKKETKDLLSLQFEKMEIDD